MKLKRKLFVLQQRRHTEKAGRSHSWAVRRIRVLNEPRLGPRRLYSVVCNLYVTAAYQCTTVPCSCAVQSTCRTAVCSRVSLQLAKPYKALGDGNLKKLLFIPALVGGVWNSPYLSQLRLFRMFFVSIFWLWYTLSAFDFYNSLISSTKWTGFFSSLKWIFLPDGCKFKSKIEWKPSSSNSIFQTRECQKCR